MARVLDPAAARSESSLPGGTSGQVGDPLYINLLPEWLTNDAYPQFLRTSELQKTFASVDRFVPAP